MNNTKNKNQGTKAWLRFTSLGIQMGLTIYIAALAGQWLDKNHPSENINWTKCLTLFAVAGTTVSTIRHAIKIQQDQEKK